jgi:hypothetical protein
MGMPERIKRQWGRQAVVDGIPFDLPVDSQDAAALVAVFPVNYEGAAALMPGNEIHPLRLWRSALLVIAVVNYRATDIGDYIEFSVGLACTHGARPAPPLLGAVFMKSYGTGQFVYDLPVTTEISVKGGKGIWGMPKHQANLDFLVRPDSVSSRYDQDGRTVMTITIEPSRGWRLPVSLAGVNYCSFRGLLMKSYVYFRGRMALSIFRPRATLVLGDHPRAEALRALQIGTRPLATTYCASGKGVLDDHFESWFVSYPDRPTAVVEGLRSVVDLGLSHDPLLPPRQSPDPRFPQRVG